MNKNIEFLSDGTVNFYQNRYVNLIAAVASLMGLIIFALILFFSGLYEEKPFIFAFCFMTSIEIPFISFFTVRFLKPKILLSINSQGIEIYSKKLIWEQIKFVNYSFDSLVFITKDNGNYKFLTDNESQAVLRDILSKHGLNH